DSRVYWGKNFLTVNVDNGDQPVNIDIRPGKYNATQLAAEVERAINEAYGDDNKIQIVQNVDDLLNINLFKLNQDGSSSGLNTAITVDLLEASYVSQVDNITLSGASPDFTREQFLAHAQAKINQALNEYAVDTTDSVTNAATLGVSTDLFARSRGTTMPAIFEKTQIVNFDHTTSSLDSGSVTGESLQKVEKSLVYSTYANRPSLSVYDNKQAVDTTGAGGNTIIYNATENTMRVYFQQNEKIRIAGNFTNASELTNSTMVNGREFTINNVSSNFIEINTTGLDFPDDNFSLAETDLFVLSDESTDVEAFFEGESNVYEGADVNFNSQRIVLRETGSEGKHHYTNSNISSLNKIDTINGPVATGLADGVYTITAANITNTTGSGGEASVEITIAGGSATAAVLSGGRGYAAGDQLTIPGNLLGGASPADDLTVTVGAVSASNEGVFSDYQGQFSLSQTIGTTVTDSLEVLGITSGGVETVTTTTDWVDEKNPPIKVTYDAVNQRLQFTVERNILGTGT
ncbi:MAG: flagellar hook-basal body protein, partial [Candidatus Puniceispirillaceae bacterium]